MKMSMETARMFYSLNAAASLLTNDDDNYRDTLRDLLNLHKHYFMECHDLVSAHSSPPLPPRTRCPPDYSQYGTYLFTEGGHLNACPGGLEGIIDA